MLNPHCSVAEKRHWKKLLEKWTKIEVCPLEDPDFRQPALQRSENVSIIFACQIQLNFFSIPLGNFLRQDYQVAGRLKMRYKIVFLF